MVSATKYYIHGGGRWREVDATTGCIEGWGRARFLVARRGKLVAVRSGPVLGALRALAEAKPSAARDGPHLPYKYPKEKLVHNKVMKRGMQTSCHHCQHCKHCAHTIVKSAKTSLSNKNQKTTAQSKKVEAGIQTTLQFRDTPGRKRKRDSTSPDLSNKKITTVATVHKTEHKPPNRLEEWKEPEPKKSKNSKSSIQMSERLKTSSNSEDDQAKLADVKKSLKRPSQDLHKSRPLKRKRESSKQSSSTQSDDVNKISNYIKPKSRFGKKPSNSGPSPKKRLNRNGTSSESSSEESKPKDVIKRKPNVSLVISSQTESQVESNQSEAEPRSRKIPHQKPAPKHKPGPKSYQRKQGKGRVGSSRGHTIKELMIDERDVDILRLYIQKNHSREELLKFDTSNQYKMSHFYQINPLVNVERCPRISRMLRSGSQHSQITIEDFASTLGLRSVSESSEPKRYRTRKRRDRSYVDSQTSGSEDKENLDKGKKHVRAEEVRRTVKRSRSKEVELSEKVSKERRSRTERDTSDEEAAEEIRDINENIHSKGTREKKEMNRRGKHTKERDNTQDTVELSSDSEQFVEKPVVKKPVWKKPTVTSTKRRLPREYSSLEDHAIVSWVSTGGRASSVNGNRLWRELEEQFARLTGQARSWHSLRNRYLRYILPRLGSLALPPAQQTRLRAAAATGELKKSKALSRRNSIFALPPRGAASRARARLPTPAPQSRTPSPETRRPSADARHRPLERTAKEPPKQSKGRRTASPPPTRAPSRRRAAPSPRYSDVTRQFANRRRARPSTDSSQQSAKLTDRRKSPVKRTDTGSNKNKKFKGTSPENSDGSDANVSGDSSESSTRSSPARSTNRPRRLSRGSGYSKDRERGKSSPRENRISMRLKELARRSATNSPRSQRRSLRLKSLDVSKVSSEELMESPVVETKRRSLIDSKKPSRTRKLFNPKVVS